MSGGCLGGFYKVSARAVCKSCLQRAVCKESWSCLPGVRKVFEKYQEGWCLGASLEVRSEPPRNFWTPSMLLVPNLSWTLNLFVPQIISVLTFFQTRESLRLKNFSKPNFQTQILFHLEFLLSFGQHNFWTTIIF